VDQIVNNLIGRQAYAVCFVPQNAYTEVLYTFCIPSDCINCYRCYRYKKDVATAKIKEILWEAFAKETQSPTAALIFVLHRPIEHASWMIALRGSCGHQLLLLSLNERKIRLDKPEGTLSGTYCHR
jgi:hypothetical protein